MPNVAPHPTEHELKDFLLGRLIGAQRVAVENHIAECEECCKHLRQVPDDTFAERFKGATPSQQDTRVAVSIEGEALQSSLPLELQNHPRYRIVKELGRGGMGVVYLAEHTFMERQVALKVISRNLVRNNRAVDRFRKEVKAAAKLSHPNIVTAHDAEEANGLHFLVMEYVEGISLAKLVQKRGPLSVPQACNVMKQIARGLQHAHEKKMVHRDIKPQNLLITKKGQVKILDFGLAKFLSNDGEESMTDAEMVLGTPDYIAPEQAYNSQNVDIRSDLYSLGCTFYFLLAGHPPYREGTAMDKMIKHNEATATPLHQLRSEVPKAVSDIVARMMAKKPEDRFQVPVELLQALTTLDTVPEEPITDLEIVEAPLPASDTAPIAQAPTLPNPPRKRRVKKKRRAQPRPWLIACVIVAALVVLGAGIVGILSAFKDDAVSPKNDPNMPLTKNNEGSPKGQGKISAVALGAKPRVYLLLPATGFWYPDYIGTYNGLIANGAEVKVVSSQTGMARPDNDGSGTAQPVNVDVLMEHLTPNDCEALLVIGGTGIKREFVEGTHANAAQTLVKTMLTAKKIVGSQCVGTELLAVAGGLANKNVASPNKEYQWVINAVRTNQGRIVEQPVVVDGPIVTARGPNDGAEFATRVILQIQRARGKN